MPQQLPDFKDCQLWETACTHRSYFNEHPEVPEDNERLEFLGDAVLGFLVGKLLYQKYPQMREGELSRLRSRLVNNEHQLAEFALSLNLDQHLRLGKGAEKEGTRQNPDVLSDTLEAVIGAYFLDAGIDAVEQFIEPLFSAIAEQVTATSELDQNYKGQLQEWALAYCGLIPRYFIRQETGADHAKEFTVEVRIGSEVYGVGVGESKKSAEKRAAKAALEAQNAGGGEN
ncbi:MAG: ribonuclease III [Halothece sp. Uz-M2-17]|nr:ribonuclease III [Halothece sp. Uz-M2-17]